MAMNPTKAQLLALIAAQILDNTSELITPAAMRTVLNDIVNAFGDLEESSDNVNEGTANLFLTPAERTKLAGIAAGANVNPAIATALEMISLTETEPRLMSPAQLVSAIAVGVTISYPGVSQADAEAGLSGALGLWSPLRVAQAIAALAPSGGGGSRFYDNTYNNVGGTSPRWIGFREAVDTSSVVDYTRISTPAGTGHELAVRVTATADFSFEIFKNTSGGVAAYTTGVVSFVSGVPQVFDISSLTTNACDWLAIKIIPTTAAPVGTYVTISIDPS